MSDSLLKLMEERVKVLTTSMAAGTAYVLDKERVIESASPQRKQRERDLLARARLELAAVTGRQQEAESALRLIEAHIGVMIT